MIITSDVSVMCDVSNQVRTLNCDIVYMLLKVSSKNDF